MTTDPASVPQNLALLKIAGNLERIADLSTNIGEDVIYMTEGRVIKHHREEGARAVHRRPAWPPSTSARTPSALRRVPGRGAASAYGEETRVPVRLATGSSPRTNRGHGAPRRRSMAWPGAAGG